jgi:hypothetical protein
VRISAAAGPQDRSAPRDRLERVRIEEHARMLCPRPGPRVRTTGRGGRIGAV